MKRNSLVPLTNTEPLGNPWQVPNGLYRDLGHCELAGLIDANLPVRYETSAPHAVLELRKLHMCFCDGNRGSNLHVLLVHGLFVQPRRKMAVWVHGNNLLRIPPCRKGADLGGGLGVSEVRLVGDVKVLARDGKRVVDGVGASVRSDSWSTSSVENTEIDHTTYHYVYVWCQDVWTRRQDHEQRDPCVPNP
jgi:hypothetical protein